MPLIIKLTTRGLGMLTGICEALMMLAGTQKPQKCPKIVCPLCEVLDKGRRILRMLGWDKVGDKCICLNLQNVFLSNFKMYLPQIAKCICEGLGPGRRISRMLVGWDEAGATAVQQSPEPQAVSSCSSSVCYAQSPLSSVLLGDTVLSPPHPIQAVSALDPPCCIQSLVLRPPVSF